jgi:hypothetical protein
MATVRTALFTLLSAKIRVNPVEKIKKVGFLKKFG